MIPLLAATSAISSIDKIGSAAISQWKQLAANRQAAGQAESGAASPSFGALLSAHGVDAAGAPAGPATASVRHGG